MGIKLDLKNKIINGNFEYWQRGTSFPAIANGGYAADRWQQRKGGSSVSTLDRSSDVPSGAFSQYSLRTVITTAEPSFGSGSSLRIVQQIEGNILRTFKDKKMVMKFWVKSSKIGTYHLQFSNAVSATRSLPIAYQINQANTWEQKTIRMSHDSSGSWNYDTSVGMLIGFILGAGSSLTDTAGVWSNSNALASPSQVNFADTVSAAFLIADVVFVEDNDGATRDPDFQLAGRDIFEELQLCQRYYEKSYAPNTTPGTVTQLGMLYQRFSNIAGDRFVGYYATRKRANSTMTVYNPQTGATSTWWDFSQGQSRSISIDQIHEKTFSYEGVPAGTNNALGGHWTADAEL